MTPNFVFFFNALLPICCHAGSDMPYLLIFVEEIVALLDARAGLGLNTYLWSELEKSAITRSSLQ